MSPAVRTLSIQSQSTRLPVLTMPTLLLFGILFVQRITSLLIHWNMDADYDLDLEQDNPCQMDGLQLNNTSCSHTVVADTINTGISVSSTGESVALEATRGYLWQHLTHRSVCPSMRKYCLPTQAWT